MDWFKFYHKDWLTENKRFSMIVEDQLCYITALCMAAASRESGLVRDADEQTVIKMTANMALDFDTKKAVGCFERMKQMITQRVDRDGKVVGFVVKNFKKRQGQAQTDYERVKKYREKQKRIKNQDDNGDNGSDNTDETGMITLDKIREEEIREDKKRGEVKIASLTPADEARSFFNSKDVSCFLETVLEKAPNLDRSLAEREIKKFHNHWSELTKNGKRQKWELEKTFELNRRFAKWISNAVEWSKEKTSKQSLKIGSV